MEKRDEFWEKTVQKQLINIENVSKEELVSEILKPRLQGKLLWQEVNRPFVNVHGFAPNVPNEEAWDYLQEIMNLEEWTLSVRNIKPLPDWKGFHRYSASDVLYPGGKIFLKERKFPEVKIVEWWVGHQPEDLWMYYYVRVLDGNKIFGKPGTVITWVNFYNEKFQLNAGLSQGFTIMQAAHGIERDNLLKILTAKYS